MNCLWKDKITEMESRLLPWEIGMQSRDAVERCDGMVLHYNCGGCFINTHMWLLHGNTYTHTHTHTHTFSRHKNFCKTAKVWCNCGLDWVSFLVVSYYNMQEGKTENTKGAGTSLTFLFWFVCNFLWIYSYSKVKS
jgi:hypothetical protein